jgi:hypothetical protein
MTPLNIATGKDGVCYPTRSINNSAFTPPLALRFCPKADDLWLKIHTLLAGKPTYIINPSFEDSFEDILSDPSQSLYYQYNKKGGNDGALKELDNYLARFYLTTLGELIRGVSQNAPLLRNQ